MNDGPDIMTVAHVLRQIQPLRRRLNELDDQLATCTDRIEQHLREYLSTRVAVTFDSTKQLAFGKHDNLWRLLIETAGKDAPHVTPLAKAPREVRARVFSAGTVVALIHAAVPALAGQIATREQALKVADALRAAFATV